MRFRRSVLWLRLLLGMALGGGGFLAWWTGPKYHVSMQTADAIREGMSLQAVVQVLGPAEETVVTQEGKQTTRSWEPTPREGWYVEVTFDERERVSHVVVTETTGLLPAPEGLLDKLRRWLRL